MLRQNIAGREYELFNVFVEVCFLEQGLYGFSRVTQAVSDPREANSHKKKINRKKDFSFDLVAAESNEREAMLLKMEIHFLPGERRDVSVVEDFLVVHIDVALGRPELEKVAGAHKH